MYGWTFLVARGRRRGYQSLLVPDFLAESNEYGVLDQATGGEPTTTITTIHGLAAGDVVLVYRTERLTEDVLPGEPVTDEFGRPLELLYGFVVRGAGVGAVDEADFALARNEAIRTYQRFLADESGFERQTSKAFVLRSAGAPPSRVPSQPPPADVAPPVVIPASAPVAPATEPASPAVLRNVALVVVLVLALSATTWYLLLRGGGGPVTDVEIGKLEASTVDCSQPITLQAVITTDDKATVSYHWESTLTTDSEPISVEFAGAGTKTVRATVQPTASSGAPVAFTQTLVVDEPNSKESSRDYTLTCR
ncbi:hypothetical protein [Kribbella antiqua]|uniref:hypothetical protein n=1 Tax=Kribbella antiqua TaxID=2512217 RepID=UPI0010428B0E|nr:hypothetical protein [Kribbella antiqua]